MIQLTAFEIQKEQNTIVKGTIQTWVDPEKIEWAYSTLLLSWNAVKQLDRMYEATA